MKKMHFTDELQIQIDDAYACPGSCAGCVLSVLERRESKPSMSETVLGGVLGSVDDYLRTLSGDISKVNITYGIADHLIFDADYLIDVCNKTSKVLSDNGFVGEDSSIFLSMSLIGKPKNIKEKLTRLKEGSKFDNPVYPVAVLDPKVLRNLRFGEDYKENIRFAKELFGTVDLSINLSAEAIKHITPEELYEFGEIHGFREVTINWTPTSGNLDETTSSLSEITKFLLTFSDLINQRGSLESSFAPVMKRSINSVMCQPENNPLVAKSVFELVNSTADNLIYHSLHIDHLGNLFPKFEAIGDVPQSPRFGYKSMGNVTNTPIVDILSRSMAQVKKEMMTPFMKSSACQGCKYSAICSVTGYHVYTKVIDSEYQMKSCPHVAFDIIDYFYKEVLREV